MQIIINKQSGQIQRAVLANFKNSIFYSLKLSKSNHGKKLFPTL